MRRSSAKAAKPTGQARGRLYTAVRTFTCPGVSPLIPIATRCQDVCHGNLTRRLHEVPANAAFVRLANDHAQFLFYRGELSSLHSVPREDFCCTVTLLSGLPGSGKDTWLARNRPGLPVVSLDAVRMHLDVEPTDDQGAVVQRAREQCRELLRARRDFAFNATNLLRQTRKRWIDLFADYGARVELIYLEPRLAKIFEQNQRRSDPVPKHVIQRLV